MKVNISLMAFQALQSSDGTFKTWGDIADGGYLSNLVNNEILGSVFRAPTDITGDNIVFEYKTFPKGKKWNDTSSADRPSLNRSAFNLPEDREMFDYKLSLFGEKEAVAWSFYIGQEDANIWKQIMNYNNCVAMHAINEYSTATGQFKVLENLAAPNKLALDYFNDTALIADGANSVMSGQTIVNLGLNPDRLSILISPKVMRRITTGIAGVNVSQGAYDAVKLGRINNLFGYTFDTSIYVGKIFENIMSDQTFDFSDLLGVVYNIDSLGFYQQSPKITNTPTDKGNLTRAFGWKPFATMLPSMEHTSFILVGKVPTIAKVNAARASLLAKNGNVYGSLPGGVLNQITDAEYQVMVANSKIFDFDPKPNVKGIGEAKLEIEEKKRFGK